MKRAIPILVVGILVLSGLGAGAVSKEKNNTEIEKTFEFSSPEIKDLAEYITVDLPETDHTLRVSGKPEMPMFVYSFDLPFGAKNIEIICTTSVEHKLKISGKIKPTPKAIPKTSDIPLEPTKLIEDPELYSSTERYPESWYDYKITCGLNPNKHRVTHISFYFYPVQYSPALSEIYCIDEATIKVIYDDPKNQMAFDDEYNLVIITPEVFSNSLQKLIQHKNDNNVVTLLKTTEDIYNEYAGNDKPEQIKYFIKDSIETYDISYVLLVGGLKSYYNANDREDPNQGSTDWYVPVRYTNIEKSGTSDPGAISDLYYADIYKEGGNFSSWDSNEDGIYAHWDKFLGVDNDELDLNPDVFVGRLPCRNKFEVSIVVNKIIKYERTSPSSKPWFDRMVGIGGLSHDFYMSQPDGEYLCDLAFGYMDNLINEEVKVYSSNNDSGGPIPVPRDIARAFTRGAGFILFEGHGHPIRWDTHPVEGTDTWIGGIHMRNMWKFFNFRKLPVVVVGGCHNGQFNVTWYKTKHSEDYDDLYWTHGDPGSECFCWRMLTIPYGGAIASVGATGLTVSWSGQPVSLNGEIEMNFFYEVGEDDATTPGQAVSGAIQKFIDENTVEVTEAHSITIVHLFGDPSLQFGGFE